MKKISCLILFLIVLGFVKISFADNTATRDLPSFYIPGETFEVTLNVDTDPINPPTGVIVAEILPQLPQNWTILDSSPDYSKYTSSTNTYKWLFFSQSGVLPFTITYTVQVPPDATGLYEFIGTISPGGDTGGDTIISDEVIYEKGDINEDGEIDISDVILCLRMAIGLDTPDPSLADMDGNEEVDISDVILILRESIGLD